MFTCSSGVVSSDRCCCGSVYAVLLRPPAEHTAVQTQTVLARIVSVDLQNITNYTLLHVSTNLNADHLTQMENIATLP